MADYSHQQLVNQHLSSARQLLALASDSASHIARHRACLESALLQTHFALHHYINELLASYHHSTEAMYIWQLCERIAENNYGLAELREWQQLATAEDSFVFLALHYPVMLAQGELPSAAVEDKEDRRSSDLIAVVNLEDKRSSSASEFVLDQSTVTWVIDECYQLIQRQREHLLEC